jgi:Ca-activated chloride channel family protein
MVDRVPEVLAALSAGVALAAELWHTRRVGAVARLAFGPSGKPSPWVATLPYLRALAVGLLAWGLAVLLQVEPKSFRARAVGENDLRHIILVMDVSPSMKLEDAGKEGKESRRKRAQVLLQSFFRRISTEQFRLSFIAVYNGAKPVVVDTRDSGVINNFLDGLDMHYAFDSGKTKLLDGISEAFKIAKPWRNDSTTIVLVTDGDTVPPTGMPERPRSVSGALVVGVGDPRTGTFIDGRQSRQDVPTLRQLALRLGGEYHDGNQKHLPTSMIRSVIVSDGEGARQLGRREYALVACATGSALLAVLPLCLAYLGTRWKPGNPSTRS